MRPRGTTVPRNRWDTLAGITADPLPRVSVIVVHYEQQTELDRTLAALVRQSYPAHLIEVIVVDDGSAHAPRVAPGIRLVRQDDRGFRAAAARNLGVQHSSGSVLCFLDADTSPAPGYIESLTRLPALAPEAVTVGRRRHADFTGVDPDLPVEVAATRHPLPEPAWLTAAYADSLDLLEADDRSYRFIISAVVACSRWFFDEVGGFDETFENYGGEDWEWAYRAWLAGAIFAHVPAAEAWHDGPDWGEREGPARELVAEKNAETLALLERIPVPASGALGVISNRADLVVSLAGVGPPAAVFATVDSVLFALPRAHVIVNDRDAGLFSADPRVIGATEAESPSSASRFDRARLLIELRRLAVVDASDLRALIDRFVRAAAGTCTVLHDSQLLMTIEHRRARQRRERWSRDDLFETITESIEDVVLLDDLSSLAAFLGGWLR